MFHFNFSRNVVVGFLNLYYYLFSFDLAVIHFSSVLVLVILELQVNLI